MSKNALTCEVQKLIRIGKHKAFNTIQVKDSSQKA